MAQQRIPPLVAVAVGAKVASLGRVQRGGAVIPIQPCRPATARQRTQPAEPRDIVARNGAVGTDVAQHHVLALLLVYFDTVAVEPVFAVVALDHPAVIVGSATNTIWSVVGGVAIQATDAANEPCPNVMAAIALVLEIVVFIVCLQVMVVAVPIVVAVVAAAVGFELYGSWTR